MKFCPGRTLRTLTTGFSAIGSVAPRRLKSLAALPVLLLLAAAGIAHAQAAASFTGAQITLPVSGVSYPQGVAIGPNGNVYIADTDNNLVKEVVAVDGQIPANPTINTLSSFYDVTGVAVDGSGNVYVATGVSQTVQEIVAVGGQIPASPTIRTLGSGFASAYSVAVDGSGNVYVADSAANAIKEIVAVGGQIPASPTIRTLGSGFLFPVGVAVDASGNVFVADTVNNAIKEIVAVGGQIPASPTINTLWSGFNGPKGVAVDASGNVYVADTSNNAIKEIVAVGGQIPASPTINALGGGFYDPDGVAVDGSGNIFVADTYHNGIKKIMRAGVNFGAEAIGTTSSALTLNFTFTASGTIGTPAVLTQGAANLDFKDAGTGSCTTNGTSHTYSVGDTCTVDVTFTPKYAGPRYGAAVLYNATGAAIATVYVTGVGVGPQVTFLPGTQSTIEQGFTPYGVAIDSSGNVYVVDTTANAVHKYAPSGSGGYTRQTDVANGLSRPHGVAVDGSGNVYVDDTTDNAVHKYAPSGSGYTKQADLTTGLSGPVGEAVDGNGNIYVADAVANAVHKYAPTGSGYTQQADVATGLNNPYSVALDGSGNVYIGDVNAVHKYAPTGSGGYTQQADVTNTIGVSVAVDASGNVYVANYSLGAVHKYAPTGSGGYTQQPVVSGLGAVAGVAVDSSGNVYITDFFNSNVLKEDFADAPSLSFAATTVHSTSSDSPQTVTLVNMGNADLSFPVPATGNNPSFPANFSLDSTTSGTCPLIGSSASTAGTLAAGASCTLPVSFTPTAVGSTSGSLVLTDTNLNAAAPTYTTQSIQVSGTGKPGPAILFSISTPPIVTAGTPFNITVTALDGYNNTATGYTDTVHFTSTDPAAVLPADSTLTNGVGTFAVTFASSGVQSIFVIDPASPMIQGLAPVSVNAVATTLTPTVTPSSSYIYGTAAPTVNVALSPSSATGITAASFTAMLDGTTPLTVSNPSTNVFAISGVPTTLGVGSHTILVSFAGTTSYIASSVSIPLTVTSLPSYMVTVLTDPLSGTVANCSNQSVGGATPDSNCSLRDAIAAANANPAGAVSTITFLPALTQNASTANPAVITLSGSYLDLTGSMKILGPGANLLQISGNHASRVLQVEAGGTGIIDGLFFTGGNGNGVAGGGLINKGTMTLSRCVVSGNTAGGNGGGIYSFQEVGGSTVTLTVVQSTIANNTTTGFGGGIAADNNTSVTIDNSTIANNTANGVGGGMWNGWGTPTTITSSTITGNTAISWGGGLDTYTAPSIANSIVSGNTMAPSGDINTVGSITDNGGNIINQSSATIQVSPLGYYGGPTPTIVPLPGSPALGAGIASSSNTTDQRGVARPTTGSIDSGAVQTNNYMLAFTTEPPAQATAGSPFTVAVTLSENGAPLSVAGVSIPLSAVINGNTTALPALTTNASGVASSSTLTLNSSGTGYTLVSKLPVTSSQTVSATSNAFDVVAVATALTTTVTPSATYIYGTTPPTVSLALTPSSATGITASMFSAVLDGKTGLTVASSGANNFGIAGIPAGLGGGAHSIQITFAGTSMYGASSVAVPLMVTKAGSKTALSAGSSSIGAGTSVTLTAQVASATTGTPTGTVSFYDGSTLLGTASLSNGAASYSTTALTTVANHTLSATYGGDANFTGSTTGTDVNVAVAALDFNFQASSALSATVAPGGTATFSYTIAPTISGVYPGPVNFMVTGPSTDVSYSLSQTTIAANAGQQTITLTVTTAASTAAVRERQLWGIGGTAVALGVLLPVGMLRRGRQLTRSAGRRLLLALLVTGASVTALGLSGCGSGGNRNLPQSYSVTVTAISGSVSHVSTVSVLVR